MTHRLSAQRLFLAEVSGSEPILFTGISEGVELAGVNSKISPCLALRHIVHLLLTTAMFVLFFMPPSNALAGNPPAVLNVPSRVLIPAIGLSSKIVPVGSEIITLDGNKYRRWETSDNLVGWHNLSAQPGQVGNMVLAGHSNIYARVFRNLKDVEIGNEIVIVSGGRKYHYRVAQKILVREQGVSVAERAKNGKLIDPTADKRLTLVTCASPVATHRLIIIARPVLSKLLFRQPIP